MNKETILQRLKEVTDEFTACCTAIEAEDFFRQPLEKWSIAQNIKHLIISARMTRLVYQLPKLMIRLYTGRPNRASRSYDELVNKYKLKLQQGGKAGGRFVPEKINTATDAGKWIRDFQTSMQKLMLAIAKWNDADLDRYLAPHPLLGKITQRELGYFTIYHTLHHLAIIRERLNDYHPSIPANH